VQLPAISELSALFNVSAPTVSKAMQALTRDGFVIGKRGIGSFTNPRITGGLSSPITKKPPLIGILSGDGMCVQINAYLARILSKSLEEITMLPATASQITLSSHKLDVARNSILNEHLDGLIWHTPTPEFATLCKRFAEEGLPVFMLDCEAAGVSSVSFDSEEAAWRCGKVLANEGRKNVLFFPDVPPWSIQADGLRRAYREAGVKINEKLFLKDAYCLQDKLKEMLSLGVPLDALFGHLMFQNEVEDLLLKMNPQIHKTCVLVNAGLSLPSKNPFRRISYEYPFQKLAEEMASLMRAQLNGDKSVVRKKVKMALRFEGFASKSIEIAEA